MMTGMTVTGHIVGIYRDYMSFEYKTADGILTLELPLNKNFSINDEVVVHLEIQVR